MSRAGITHSTERMQHRMAEAEERNKTLVIDAFDTLFNKRDYAGCRMVLVAEVHSAQRLYPPGREGPFDIDQGQPARSAYEHQLVLAGGDYVTLHGRFANVGLPVNWVVVDVLRVEDGRAG